MLLRPKTLALITTSLLLAFSSFAVVTAQEQDEVNDTSVSAQNDQVRQNEQARQKRIEERKTLRQEFVSQAKEERLRQRCANAQGKIRSVSAKIASVEVGRLEVYDRLLKKLSALNDRLQVAGQPTNDLEIELAELAAAVATFEVEVTGLNIAIADITAMDCAQDPIGFDATLRATRDQLAVVKSAATNIKVQVNEQLRPLLTSLVKASE